MLSRTAFRSVRRCKQTRPILKIGCELTIGPVVPSRQPATVLLLPRAVASSTQTRGAASSANITPDEAHAVLVAQRKKRPIAPHLSIYQPQLTWYASAANRVTGCILAGSVYLFGAAYAVAPLAGFHLESATIATSFAALPVVVKVLVKGSLALPFTFHTFNGLRHLTWDTARELTIKGVYRTGYAVLGLTAVSSIYLTFFV